MIDLSRLATYREDNRLEAKKATGGFPQSLWETYSAFANSLGGVILLGVKELADHSLRAVALPHPNDLVEQFWEEINDKGKVSDNILSPNDVTLEKVDGKTIVVITVPQAPTDRRPIYIGNDPFTGAYKRNGEGDFRCSAEEVRAMIEKAASAR